MAYLPYVHVTQGTASLPRFSHGNTVPLTQLPWGMAGFMPQTEVRGGNWCYHPGDRCLEGVRLTHQPSPWVGDFGSLLFMPQAGKPCADAGRWSGYRPEEAVLAPDYQHLRFLRSEADFELTPTERGAAIRLAFGREKPFLSLISTGNDISFRVDAAARRVYGRTNSCNPCIRKVPAGYQMAFVLEFDCPLEEDRTILEEGKALHVALGSREAGIRFAISFISEEQAVRNLENELAGRDFDAVRAAAAARWEELLGRIRIKTADEDMLHTFYSCMYRLFLYPNKMYEPDADGRPIHYDSHNDTVRPGVMYTNNGFWDTFRTVYPLYSLIAPKEYEEIMDGYIQQYENTGWMPKWPSLVETGIMPGSLVDAVVAQAAVTGILKGDKLRKAFEGVLKHATQLPEGCFGRAALESYLKYGYVARDCAVESVNCTMDYAYGDYCIARVAECLGETAIMEEFDKRAMNYKKLFDPSTGFMRGRDSQGKMAEEFDPFGWGGEYTEGGPWQSSFSVYHDFDGLAALHGGREAFVKKLDELFATPPRYREGGYGFEIHEMAEMAALDFGQCAISNQPSFHYPWLFAAMGQTEKTAYWVERLAKETMSWRPDGFPGDEDNGTMAAWYIFAVMGMYPLCPGKPAYIKGKQLADEVELCGKPLRISGEGWIAFDEI